MSAQLTATKLETPVEPKLAIDIAKYFAVLYEQPLAPEERLQRWNLVNEFIQHLFLNTTSPSIPLELNFLIALNQYLNVQRQQIIQPKQLEDIAKAEAHSLRKYNFDYKLQALREFIDIAIPAENADKQNYLAVINEELAGEHPTAEYDLFHSPNLASEANGDWGAGRNPGDNKGIISTGEPMGVDTSITNTPEPVVPVAAQPWEVLVATYVELFNRQPLSELKITESDTEITIVYAVSLTGTIQNATANLHLPKSILNLFIPPELTLTSEQRLALIQRLIVDSIQVTTPNSLLSTELSQSTPLNYESITISRDDVLLALLNLHYLGLLTRGENLPLKFGLPELLNLKDAELSIANEYKMRSNFTKLLALTLAPILTEGKTVVKHENDLTRKAAILLHRSLDAELPTESKIVAPL